MRAVNGEKFNREGEIGAAWRQWASSLRKAPCAAGGGDPVTTSPKDPWLTPLGLSETEQADPLEFLKTVSVEPVPNSLLIAP